MKQRKGPFKVSWRRALCAVLPLFFLGMAVLSGWVICLCEHERCGEASALAEVVQAGEACVDVSVSLGELEEVRGVQGVVVCRAWGAPSVPWREVPLWGMLRGRPGVPCAPREALPMLDMAATTASMTCCGLCMVVAALSR